MVRALTDRQKQVLQLILDLINEKGYPPTFRELGRALGIKSTKGITDHLDVLKHKGYIDRVDNRSRAITVLKTPDDFPLNVPPGKIPLVGKIAAGQPSFDEGNIEEYLGVDSSLFGRGTHFALKVKGDSMINEHICDGDYAVIRKQDKVENGEIAAVMVEGIQEEATLKRWHQTSVGSITLKAANKSFPDIKVDTSETRVEVIGKLVGIIRQE